MHQLNKRTMSIKRFAQTILLVAVAVAALSACNKMNQFDRASIVGVWDLDHAEVSVLGLKTTIQAEDIYSMGKELLGTDNVYFLDATLDITEQRINGYDYEMNGNRIMSIGDTDLSYFRITFEKVNTSSLVLRYNISGIVEDMVYNKR